MTNALDTDAQWDAAAALARSVAVPKKRSRRWWTWAWIGTVLVGMGAIAYSLTSWFVPVGGGEGVEFVASTVAVQSTLIALAVVVLLSGVFWGSVTERFVERSSTITSPLNRTEKRGVRRQLAGKASADENRMAIILAIARENQRITEGAVPQYVALFLLYAAIAIGAVGSAAAYMPYLSIAIALSLVGSALYLAIRYIRTARFIRTHNVPATAPGPPVDY